MCIIINIWLRDVRVQTNLRDTNNVYVVIILMKIVFQYCNIHEVHVIVNAIFNLRCQSSCICV